MKRLDAPWVGLAVIAALAGGTACVATVGEDAGLPLTDGGSPDGGPSDGGAFDGGWDAGAPADGGSPDGGAADGSVCGAEAMIPAWITSFVPSAEIYVAPGGDDLRGGETPATAVRTTARAFALASPGTRLNFAAGSYSGGVLANFPGSRSAPLVIRSSDGPRAARFDGGLGLDNVHAIVIDGIELFGSSGHGVQVSSGSPGPWDAGSVSSDIAILHSFIHDTGYASTKMSQARGVTIIGNTFTRAGRVVAGRQNVELVAVDDTVIAGNEAWASGGHFNEVKGGAENAVIYGNYVHDNGGGILVGGDCTGTDYLVHRTADYEARNVKVWGNVVVNAPSEAFRIVSCHDCLIANNTSVSSATETNALKILNIGFSNPGGACGDVPLVNQNLTIVNNVFAASAISYVIASNASSISGLALHHNAWAGVGTSFSDLPFRGEPSSLYDVSLLLSPPPEVRPGAGSPLLGAGAAIADAPGDAAGRCWSEPRNIGAY